MFEKYKYCINQLSCRKPTTRVFIMQNVMPILFINSQQRKTVISAAAELSDETTMA